MALTSVGFGDDTVDERDWARINGATGSPYSYLSIDAWRPYAAGGTRTVSFAQGTTLGWGVEVTTDGGTSISLPAAGSGTVSYLVCLRRRGGAGQRTGELVALLMSGASPVGRQSNPGTVDDQPLCIATVTAGSNTVTSIRDMRVHAAKAHYAPSLEAAMLAGAQLGARFVLPDGSKYVSTLSPAGTVMLTPEKEPDPPVIPPIPRIRWGTAACQFGSTGWTSISHNLGYSPAFITADPRLTAESGLVTVEVQSWNTTSMTVVAKASANTATGWKPYVGNLTNVDWMAVG